MLFKLYQQNSILLLKNKCGAIFLGCGRNVHDFINKFDNLHEYFCFPKLQPPSFCVEEHCETSLMLHYRSTRKGFTLFVKGNKKHDGVNSGCAKWFTRATGNWFDPKP